MSKKKQREEVINFYNVLPKDLLNKSRNPRFDQHGLTAINRCIIIGPSGAGKTNIMLNLIHSFRGTYDKILLVTRNADEPLYNFVKMKLGDDFLIFENMEELPPLNDFPDLYGGESQILTIFDDMVLSDRHEMKRIEEFYIRCRKICGGVAVYFLSQSYYRIPKIIRSNANYCFIKRIDSKKDLKMILGEYNLPYTIEELVRIYEMCSATITDFMLIDISAPPERRVRHNYHVLSEDA